MILHLITKWVYWLGGRVPLLSYDFPLESSILPELPARGGRDERDNASRGPWKELLISETSHRWYGSRSTAAELRTTFTDFVFPHDIYYVASKLSPRT